VDKRALGKSGIEVPPLCFGGNVFGWTVDQVKSFTLLDALVGEGINFVDTADVYARWAPGNSGGESETILGDWMKSRGNRERLIVATTVGSDMGEGKKGLSKAYILQAAEDSLRRLQTDYIDLYQSHIDDESTPLEETLEAYDTLIKAGKVRAIGASNYTGARLEQALSVSAAKALPSYVSLQPKYNLYDREPYESEIEPVVMKHGIAVIPYFALAAGFLTGKYRSEADFGKSARGGGMSKYLNERGLRILAALDEVAARHQVSPAQVAIAWLASRPSVTAPIASATSIDQVEQLVAAAALALDSTDLALLDTASAQ
jgi:aryl-alcohol dehydrogenase-like predicted oxidoreductase